MQTTEFTFAGADGVQIFATSWLPAGTPRDHLVLAHGYAEHLGATGPWRNSSPRLAMRSTRLITAGMASPVGRGR